MNNTNFSRSESGQSIVMIVFAIIALLGFSALALDGGMFYSARRQAQNASDTAAFAAGLYISDDDFLSGADLSQAAITATSRALANGYDDNGDTNLVEVRVKTANGWDLPGGPIIGHGMKYFIVETKIWTTVDTAFAHMFFPQTLQAEVVSQTRVRPQQAIVFGYAMFGANFTECDTFRATGTGDVFITGGGLFSNSDACGSCDGLNFNGGALTQVTGGSVGVAGCSDVSNNSTVSPAPDDFLGQIELPDIPEPNCSHLPVRSTKKINQANDRVFEPGIYYSIKVTNGNIEFASGMYCFTGPEGLRVLGGNILGNGVMFVMQNGDFNVSGNGMVQLHAAPSMIDANGGEYGGMLIFMPYNNSGQVIASGGTDSNYSGTIYAPGPTPNPQAQPKCTLSGNGDTIGFDTQLICNTINIAGTSEIHITFDNSLNYENPPIIDLLE